LISESLPSSTMLSKSYIFAAFALAAQVQFEYADADQPLDWSIAFTEGSTEAKTDSGGVQIIQHYIIGNTEKPVVEVLDYDCSVVDDTGLFNASTTSEPNGDKFNLNVTVDVSEDKIMGSSYWNADNGQLKLCVKVQLMADDASVSFYETQVELNVDMTVDFDSGEVTVNKLEPATETTDTNLWYDVGACLCAADDTSCAASPEINQNEQFSLCLYPTEDEILIEEVLEVKLVQDNVVKSTPVDNNSPDALSRVKTNGTTHVLTTWTLSSFFADENPSPVTAQGVLKLAFKEMAAERRLRMRDSSGRILSTDTGSFEVHLELGYDPAYAGSGKTMIHGFGAIVIAFFISYWFH